MFQVYVDSTLTRTFDHMEDAEQYRREWAFIYGNRITVEESN
jgi:hypothetical protein